MTQDEPIRIPRLVEIRQAADLIGVSPEHLVSQLQAAGLYCRKIAGRWKAKEAEIMRWLETRPGDPAQDRLKEDFRKHAASAASTRQRLRARLRPASGSR